MPISKLQSQELIEARIRAEARELAGTATNVEQQFLRVGLENGKNLEPSGRLVGARMGLDDPSSDAN